MVKVRHSEGAAIHTDPESCADAREGIGEALTGARAGEVLSGESNVVRGADAVVACRRQQARVRHRCERWSKSGLFWRHVDGRRRLTAAADCPGSQGPALL